MCNALKELVNEGVQTGIQKGRLEGIQAIVRTCKNLNLDEKSTVNNVMQEFPVSEEEATAYVKNIGNTRRDAGCLSDLHPISYDIVK